MFTKTLITLTIVASGLAYAADDNRSEKEKCNDRTYNAERNRGETHEKATDHAADHCRDRATDRPDRGDRGDKGGKKG